MRLLKKISRSCTIIRYVNRRVLRVDIFDAGRGHIIIVTWKKTMLPASSILSVSIEQWQTKEDDGNYSY